MLDKNIFLLWLQGWENATWLNKQVAISWETNNPEWRVHYIDLENLKNYVTDIDYIYDTNKILQHNYDGDFITASLNYYIDIFYYVDFLTVGIRYLLYILNLFTAFVGIKHIKNT